MPIVEEAVEPIRVKLIKNSAEACSECYPGDNQIIEVVPYHYDPNNKYSNADRRHCWIYVSDTELVDDILTPVDNITTSEFNLAQIAMGES